MLNDEPGNNFRQPSSRGVGKRGDQLDRTACVLILDPILGSRFSLAQAVSHPSCIVKTAATVGEASAFLEQGDISLIIVDEELMECDGVDFLVEVRGRFPATCRALVTGNDGIPFIRGAIERAGLCFLLSKPWSPSSLKKTVREILSSGIEFRGWTNLIAEDSSKSIEHAIAARHPESAREHEILLRGLLAGLNSCEFESEVFELLHTELATPFGVSEWLWIDEERSVATRIAGDWPVEGGVSREQLELPVQELLAKARQSVRVTRLDDALTATEGSATRTMCLGLAIRDGGRRKRTCLIWADRRRLVPLVSMIRELQPGLQLVFRRISLAVARTEAARRLAQHVSEELRTPFGALTHVIDRLRGEAERVGLPTEWVDRVSSESERVARAVEHFEGEMRTDVMQISSSSN
jgi:DNA-binding NarL/FixJ family response regulator